MSPEQESLPSTPQPAVGGKEKQRAIEESPTQQLSDPEPGEPNIRSVVLALDDTICS